VGFVRFYIYVCLWTPAINDSRLVACAFIIVVPYQRSLSFLLKNTTLAIRTDHNQGWRILGKKETHVQKKCDSLSHA